MVRRILRSGTPPFGGPYVENHLRLAASPFHCSGPPGAEKYSPPCPMVWTSSVLPPIALQPKQIAPRLVPSPTQSKIIVAASAFTFPHLRRLSFFHELHFGPGQNC